MLEVRTVAGDCGGIALNYLGLARASVLGSRVQNAKSSGGHDLRSRLVARLRGRIWGPQSARLESIAVAVSLIGNGNAFSPSFLATQTGNVRHNSSQPGLFMKIVARGRKSFRGTEGEPNVGRRID